MAQSPEKNATTTEVIRYDLGWNAINALLRSGRSLSGHERNCCFLNTGGERFADVSAAAGLNFVDDGRVLALSDWDFDGDIDFWVANRSGPQARFLRNEVGREHHFVAFKLEGVRCNRDAIGARVTIHLEDKGVLSQTLRAGDGYLSQSSKWLHFGLGTKKHIAKIVIRWPNGHEQTLQDLLANQFYRVREGVSDPLPWSPPTGLKRLEPSAFESRPTTDQARIVLLSPMPLPDLTYVDEHNIHRPLMGDAPQVRLVNLWTTWCKPCLKELSQWRDRSEQIKRAGLHIVTVNVDTGGEQADDDSRFSKVAEVWNRLQLPFENGIGSDDLIASLDVMQRAVLSRQRPLPVPSSFLIDREGRLRVVYKGPVSVDTLLRDAELIDAEPDRVLAAATPFEGRWLSPPGGSTTLQVALKFIEGGYTEQSQQYIRSLIQQNDKHPEYLSASLLNLFGAMAVDEKQYEEAAKTFGESLALDPHNRQAHMELGAILLRFGRGADAAPHFEEVLKASPNDPEMLYKLGLARMQQGKLHEARRQMLHALELRPHPLAHWQLGNIYVGLNQADRAIAEYETALKLDPNLIRAANNLAWLLATSMDDELRNGPRAVEVAEQICTSAASATADQLDTLAAAYAEAARFDNAVAAANDAIRLAMNDKNETLAERIRQRLEHYRRRTPFRESLGQSR